MKLKFTSLFTALLALIFNSVVVTAQTGSTTTPTTATSSIVALPLMPDSLPIASPAALRKYAEGLVNQVYVSNYSSSISGKTYAVADFTETDADTSKMKALAAAQKLEYDVSPADKITLDVGYYFITPDKRATFSMFVGSTDFKLEQKIVGGPWTVPTSAYSGISIGYTDWVPVAVFGVQNAWEEFTDVNGNVTGNYNLNNDNRVNQELGYIYLSSSLIQRSGTLYIQRGDTRYSYSLSDGKLKASVKIAASGFSPDILGDRTLANDTISVTYQPGDVLVHIRFTKDVSTGVVTIPSTITGAAIPQVSYIDSATFWADPKTPWTMLTTAAPNFKASAGRLITIRFDLPQMAPLPVNYYGPGKGSVDVTTY